MAPRKTSALQENQQSEVKVSRKLESIVSQIATLSSAQRRQLLRQLKAMGLLEPEELMSDRNALSIALAVQPSLAMSAKKRRAVAQEPTDPPVLPPRPAARPRQESYRSPVRGHAVIGSPRADDAPPAAMSPLPGQAPEQPVRIVFDGGSRGNPGEGYGSYALDWPGQARQIVQLNFGDQVTNNEAEYDSLIAGLEAVRKRLLEQQIDAKAVTLSIWGDSQLVRKQIRGEFRCKEPRLQLRLKQARALLGVFGNATLNYHPREKSVEILGH